MNQARKFNTPQEISKPTQFSSVADAKPIEISWDEIVNIITNNDTIRKNTFKAQELFNNGQKAAYARCKSLCGAYTPASYCEGGHSGSCIKTLTGIVMVDLDHLPNLESVNTALEAIKNDPHTFIAYITCSGLGIRILAPFTASEPQVAYLDAWRWVNDYYKMITGFDYDRATKDASRLSYFSHDPNCYFNPDAKKFFIDNSPHETVIDANTNEPLPIDRVEQILSKQGMHFVQGQRHHFLINAAFLLNKMGIDKEQVIAHYSDLHDDPREVANIVNWAYDHAVQDHATWKIVKRAKSPAKTTTSSTSIENVSEPQKPKKSPQSKHATIADIREWLNSTEALRYNELSGITERYVNKQWVDVNDRTINAMWEHANNEMEQYVTITDFSNLLKSENLTLFNPITDYLSHLPQWKPGDHDYIDELMCHVHTNNDELFRIVFPKWLVSMIASWINPNVTNQKILTFIGAQGVYKSTFFRKLLPPELNRYFLVKGNASYLTKDDKMATGRYCLIAFEEIDALKLNDLNAIKALVTTEIVDERAAYARTRERLNHIASFCATGNNPQFLTDITGNRRWSPFLITAIDSPFDNPINYDGLYAQIYYLLNSGFRYWFTTEEDHQMESYLKQFCSPCIEEELIMQNFELPQSGKNKITQFLSATAIKTKCEIGSRFILNINIVNQVLKNLGYVQRKRNGMRGYLVVERTYDEVKNNSIDTAAQIMEDERPHPEPPQQRTILQDIEEQDNPFLT